MGNTPSGGEDDYIYRGEQSTPQDGEPWQPPAPPPPQSSPPHTPPPATPPPATPPTTAPYPTSPPPGFPPQQPPNGEPFESMAEPKKRKRWPWIVAGLVLLCGLPLGGCLGLVAFGVNELNERSDAIEESTADFFAAVDARDGVAVETLSDGRAPCSSSAALLSAFEGIESGATWNAEKTAFVERTGNSSLSSNADPETLFIEGRADESAAVVNGTLTTSGGVDDLQVLLSKPGSQWRICTITLR